MNKPVTVLIIVLPDADGQNGRIVGQGATRKAAEEAFRRMGGGSGYGGASFGYRDIDGIVPGSVQNISELKGVRAHDWAGENLKCMSAEEADQHAG